MRLLFFGDAGPTGFGTVTIGLGRALLALGLDVRFVSQNTRWTPEGEFLARTVDIATFSIGPDALDGHLGVTGLHWAIGGLLDGSAPVLMGDKSAYGDWKPDAALFLGDYDSVHVTLRDLGDKLTVPTFHYVPIEGVGLAPTLGEVWSKVHPIACSEFGAEQVEKVTGTRPPVAYHGVDDIFAPIGPNHPLFVRDQGAVVGLTTRQEVKYAWGRVIAEANGLRNVPKKWLLRTDRHMPRKRYNALIRSLLPVLARHPEWGLVMHCGTRDEGGDLDRQIAKVPPPLRRQVLVTRAAGIDRDLLMGLYNAADLYVSNSAEGFGLTIAEAIACGTPAVGVGYSAVPEVIGPAGVVVAEGGLIDDQYDSFWWAANEHAFGAAVEDLMTHDTRRVQLGRLGPEHVRTNFRWSICAEVIRDHIADFIPVEVAA